MQQRIFGIETEYSIAARGKNGLFYADFKSGEWPALFLTYVLPLDDESPERIKALSFFPQAASFEYWLGANGARFYFDNQQRFPEYATPECADLREAVIHSMAGDSIVEDLRQEVLRLDLLRKKFDGAYTDLFIFKVNTFFRDDAEPKNTAGCHENYLTRRLFEPAGGSKEAFSAFSAVMAPFFATRQIFDGAGGIRWDGTSWKYVLSQRIFFIDKKASRVTSGAGRGFIHFKSDADEAPIDMVRLHIHCGDSTMSPWGKYIAMGATHLMLRAIEEGDASSWKYQCDAVSLIADARSLSSDVTLQSGIHVQKGGREIQFSAIELQRAYVDFVMKHVRSMTPPEYDLLQQWILMLKKLEASPMDAARELDWAIKLEYLNTYHGGALVDAKARFASMLYHELSARGIYHKLLKAGSVRPFVPYEETEKRRYAAPPTRAEFRARYLKALLECLERDKILTIRWDVLPGLLRSFCISDPFQRTSQEGEANIALLQRKKNGELTKEELAKMKPQEYRDLEV